MLVARNIVLNRLSVWETAAPHFKGRKFADANSLQEVTFTTLEAQEEDAIKLGGPRTEFLHCFLGLFARIARLSQVQIFLVLVLFIKISILIKNL